MGIAAAGGNGVGVSVGKGVWLGSGVGVALGGRVLLGRAVGLRDGAVAEGALDGRGSVSMAED